MRSLQPERAFVDLAGLKLRIRYAQRRFSPIAIGGLRRAAN